LIKLKWHDLWLKKRRMMLPASYHDHYQLRSRHLCGQSYESLFMLAISGRWGSGQSRLRTWKDAHPSRLCQMLRSVSSKVRSPHFENRKRQIKDKIVMRLSIIVYLKLQCNTSEVDEVIKTTWVCRSVYKCCLKSRAACVFMSGYVIDDDAMLADCGNMYFILGTCSDIRIRTDFSRKQSKCLITCLAFDIDSDLIVWNAKVSLRLSYSS
jgi:hypothetical protein